MVLFHPRLAQGGHRTQAELMRILPWVFSLLEYWHLQILMCIGITQGVDFQDLPQESDA